MDATKWTQGFQEMLNVKPMEQIMISNTSHQQQQQQPPFISTAINGGSGGNNNNNNTAATMETKKTRPQEKINCPRCNSTNTKFCYYNNYSLTQPRYFCKSCRRYWTEGGSLRNVPVGGSSRKNKIRSSSSSSSTPLASNPKPSPILFSSHKSKDLNLFSFPVIQDHHQFLHMPKIENNNTYASSSALELLRSNNGASSRNMNTFMMSSDQMMDSNSVLYSFPTISDYKQSNLSFSINDNHHQGIGHNQRSEDNDGAASRVLFPELSNTTQEKINHGNNNTYWSGMFSNTGGSSW